MDTCSSVVSEVPDVINGTFYYSIINFIAVSSIKRDYSDSGGNISFELILHPFIMSIQLNVESVFEVLTISHHRMLQTDGLPMSTFMVHLYINEA